MRVWDGSIMTASSRPSADGLRLGRSIWPFLERPNGTWRAVVMARDGTHGEAEYADGSDEIDAARRARTRHSTRQLRAALSGLAEVAQSEVVQLVFAEAVVARIPGGRTRAGRRAALVGTVWMLDPKRRAATNTIAARPSNGRAYGYATVPPIETSQTRRLARWNASAGRYDAIEIHPADHALPATAPGGFDATWRAACRPRLLSPALRLRLPRGAATRAVVVPAYRRRSRPDGERHRRRRGGFAAAACRAGRRAPRRGRGASRRGGREKSKRRAARLEAQERSARAERERLAAEEQAERADRERAGAEHHETRAREIPSASRRSAGREGRRKVAVTLERRPPSLSFNAAGSDRGIVEVCDFVSVL